jgi:predicted small lipoprotein YifL
MKKALKTLLFSLLILALAGCRKKPDQLTGANVDQKKKQGVNTETSMTSGEATNEDSSSIKTSDNKSIENTLYPAFITENNIRKYGYINEQGNFIIQPAYDGAANFSEGLAVVYTTGTYKVIDTKENVIYQSDSDIKPFQNGAAIISKVTDKLLYGYIDTAGNEIANANFYEYADNFNSDNKAFVYSAGESSIIDKSGNILESYPIDSKYQDIIDIQDGYIIYSDPDTGNYGVINYKGEDVLEPKNNPYIARYVGNDLFEIKQNQEDSYLPASYCPSALMNIKGEQLTDFNLYDLSDFNNGYASVTDDKYTYLIDTSGKEVTSFPKLEGRGTLTLLGDIIKAEIDRDLLYMKKEDIVLWYNSDKYNLTSDINVKEVKYKPNKYVSVYYPIVEDLESKEVEKQINNKLYELFIDNRKNITAEDQLSVEDSFTARLQNQLLVINQIGYDYPFGAAHGMPIKNYYYFNTNTGEFYTLKDLFVKDSDYVTAITSIIKEMIEKQEMDEGSMLFPDSFKTISKDHDFYLTGEGLVIYFYPYDIAPYATGFPEFIIPFDKLSDIIDEQGAFWKAFN